MSVSAYFEIAYATVTKRLCIFTGTGFSKAITNDKAPSWKELLRLTADAIANNELLLHELFPQSGEMPLTLEETAQIISMEMAKNGRSVHQEVAKIITDIKIASAPNSITQFFQGNSFHVVTTNYDKFAEELFGEGCHSITPGRPIPRSQSEKSVYHIHGSIDSPAHMILTSEDYFNFINSPSYFSRKLSTTLHENTIVIIGYSLGDTNLKAIINDYTQFIRNHSISRNIFFVSRSAVSQYVKDYYAHCYGIRVLDNTEVEKFFEKVINLIPRAKDTTESSIQSVQRVLTKGHTFTNDYIKLENSLFDIVSALAAIGYSVNDEQVVATLKTIFDKKIEFTSMTGAWPQYEHLAKWLTYIGSILDIGGTTLKSTYLHAVLTSMNSMSRKQILGYSWHAYNTWQRGWADILPTNRALIAAEINAKSTHSDAKEMVTTN